MKSAIRYSLSLKLLRIALLAALLVGSVLSCAQIAYNAYQAREAAHTEAQRILAIVREPATEAIYSLDREMAMQVLEGLFQHEAVRYAAIGQPGEPMLAEKSRPLLDSSTRWLSDPLFGAEKSYSIPLNGRGASHEHYGDLRITLDTAPYGADFLAASEVVFVSGLLRALALGLVLFLLLHWLLTRPLSKLITHLSRINPDRPGEHTLPMLRGHEHDELGRWIDIANQLLASIERNGNLRQQAEDNLQRVSQYDFLTNLPNRLLLQQRLAQSLQEAARQKHCVAVLCLGLDDFKGINEQFSYQTGDQLLVALAERLRSFGARLGAPGRLGGDEFAMVLAGIGQPYDAAELAQQILDDLNVPFELDHQQIQLRATIGIALYPDDGDTAEKLLQKAEQTMTLAKSRSRNRYQFYVASIDSEIRHRRELEKDLRGALAHNELQLTFQPQVDYRDRRIVGVEALLRWQHPSLGWIAPDLFIPLAEQNGSILGIGEWVLDQACRQLREWHDMGFVGLRMAVNLSTVQLRHNSLPRVVSNLMQRHRLPPRSLELEVTETGLMEDISTAAQNLHSLRRAGAQIAIDDFGTGYSSLSYLKSLPLDKIKIDKSFVQDVLRNDDDAAIVRAIIQLGKSLGMQVIAEGVETAEQEAYIIAEGCNEGQGYLYGKPLSAREMTQRLKRSLRIIESS